MTDLESQREDLAELYMEQLPYEPYPVQQEALLAWYTSEQGILVCAPTGTGKTLIAEAAVFEALKTGRKMYYTTPLIALTDQKFDELQQAAMRWGYDADQVGLVTGNRRVNPDAPILVVVAEILLNRLLHPEAFDFAEVSSVVMDEFHSFNDPERGIVWELSLSLLPASVRTMLLSATVGNSVDFVGWLRTRHNRRLDLIQSDERKVPLTFEWVGDELLTDFIEKIAAGDEQTRRTPSLIFCFNREECWSVAEQLKGKRLIDDARQKQLAKKLDSIDLKEGAGPKLRQLLMRGVGVHHAGVLPKYRRVVESLYQEKLLAVTVCTETLAAGINLPARSVVLPTILKGKPGDRKPINPSSAQQMFGRAGRPQFDSQGFVYCLAHEDDVKIHRWRLKYDQIPEDTKDPGLLKAKKQLKKKMPKRRDTQQYWNEQQFDQLRSAPAGKLASRGGLPWRLLAYMLEISPEVQPIRELVSKRLFSNPKQLEAAQKELDRMLMTLWRAGYVELEPKPPLQEKAEQTETTEEQVKEETEAKPVLTLGQTARPAKVPPPSKSAKLQDKEAAPAKPQYKAIKAQPTEAAADLARLRGVHPLYGLFLLKQLGIADRAERIQAIESLLELPMSLGPAVWTPDQEELPPGPLATERLDEQLLKLGLATQEELSLAARKAEEEEQGERGWFEEPRPRVLSLADKLRRLFDFEFPGVRDVKTTSVWVVGEVLNFGGDFDKYITSNKLHKQEGVIFRHLLRFILLVEEFAQLCPPECTVEEWQDDLYEIVDQVVDACQAVDPSSTDETLEQAQAKREGLDEEL